MHFVGAYKHAITMGGSYYLAITWPVELTFWQYVLWLEIEVGLIWISLVLLRQKQVVERKPKNTLVERALEAGVINAEQKALIDEAEAARNEAVAVDAFSRRDYAKASA